MIKPLMLNTFDPSSFFDLPPSTDMLLKRRMCTMGLASNLFYEEPVHVVHANGVNLFGPNGETYLDVYNNVPSVGHCHTRVVEAVRHQVGKLNIHTRYLNDIVVEYSERLLSTFPDSLDTVIFNNSGSEAADLALRLSRQVTGQTGVIVTSNAYHGVTSAIAEMSPSLGQGVPLAPHVRVVPAPDGYRMGSNVGSMFADAVEAAIFDLKRHGIGIAALFADTIFSSDGVFADPPGFLCQAVRHVKNAGGLFVADEVQPGFGRTGSMWGFERHGVKPDLVMLGKPMANGIPIGAVVASRAILETFGAVSRYASTFGGNPVSCAAAIAVLDIIRDDGLIEHAGRVGRYLLEALREVGLRHATVGDVRGAGLFLAVDFVSDHESKTPDPAMGLAVINALRRERILIGAAGMHGHVLKIRPPLVFTEANADIFVSALERVLDDLAQGAST